MAGRSPRGTYVRNSPDWRYRDLAVAVGAGGSTAAGFPQSHLYNNDQSGNSLFIVGLACQCGVAGVTTANVRLQFGQNVPAGSLGSPPQAVWLGEALPSGEIFNNNDAAGPTGTVISIIGSGGDGALTTPGWPLFILPPNFWLQFTGDTHNTTMSFTAWYLVQRS